MFLIFIDTSDTWFNALQMRFPSSGHNIHGPSFSNYLSTMCKVLGLRGEGQMRTCAESSVGAVTAMADSVPKEGAGGDQLFLLQV